MADFDFSQVLRLTDELSRAPATQAVKLRAQVDKTAREIESLARATAPVGATGDLKASIAVQDTGPLSRLILTNVHYGAFVEYGTARQAPQPFMTPAVEACEEPFYLSVEAIAAGLLD